MINKCIFTNIDTDEKLTRFEFNKFVWDECKRQFKDNNPSELWVNLTFDEQLEIFCEQYDFQLESRNWQEGNR